METLLHISISAFLLVTALKNLIAFLAHWSRYRTYRKLYPHAPKEGFGRGPTDDKELSS